MIFFILNFKNESDFEIVFGHNLTFKVIGEKNFIVNMVVHISCEATTIECSYYKRSLPTI